MELEQLLQKVPNYTNDSLIITEAGESICNSKIVYVNQAFMRLTGYSGEEAIGKTPQMLHGPKTERGGLDRIRKALRLRKPVVEEIINYTKQKHEYWVEQSISPVLDEKGECCYFISIDKDITERKVMQEATEKQGIEFLNSEMQTRAILYSIVDGIITFRGDGSIENASPAVEKMFGYDAEVIEEKTIIDLFPENLRHEVEQWISVYDSMNDSHPREILALRADGTVFNAEINLSRVEREEKKLFVMAVRDVTELKTAQAKAHKQTERVTLLQEAAIIANSATSCDGAIESILNIVTDHYWFSAAHCWLVDGDVIKSSHIWVGSELDSLKQVSFESVFSSGCGSVGKAYALGRPQLLNDISNSSGFIRRDAAIKSDINAVYVFPVYSGNEIVAVMEFFNGDEWAYNDDDLEIIRNIGSQLGQAIERDVTQKTLVQAKEAAETATRAKSEFLANMSHELRTPMNGIVGLTELLKETSLSSDQAECITALTTSASSLLAILNDILDFSKIEARELALENIPFSIHESVENVYELMAPLAANKGLKLKYNIASDVPAGCMGDSNRLQQVILNLVSNAIKFTAQGEVVINVSVRDGDLFFQVKDTGIGILQEYHKHIFNKFTQADTSTTRKYGGTGLGLAICRQLVELMGGEIEVESAPGMGSSFKFKYPLVESVLPLGKIPELVGALPIENAKILMVEDHPINQMLLQKLLSKLGVKHIVKAENGVEALEAVKNDNYSLVLMDCQMPELDGYEATRLIRLNEERTSSHLPIIAMTANAMVGDREKCLKTGMDDYMSKPIDLSTLTKTLSRWLVVGESKEMPAVQESNIQMQDPIDLEHLRNFTDGNANEEKILFNLFLERADATVTTLEYCTGNAYHEEWRQAAHLLKGASGNLGARHLFELCHDGEVNYQADQARKILCVDDIRSELGKIRHFINSIQGEGYDYNTMRG